jgi:hypothetical protein
MIATTVPPDEPPCPPVPDASPELVVVGTTTWLTEAVGVPEAEGEADGETEADGDGVGDGEGDGVGEGVGVGVGDGEGLGATTVTTPAMPVTNLQW